MLAHGFVERAEQSQADIDGNRRTDEVDRWKLAGARSVDADRHRRVRPDAVVVAVDMHVAAVERRMRGDPFELCVDAIVLVMVERRADLVERQREYQQPAREQPCATHTAAEALRESGEAWGVGHGRSGCERVAESAAGVFHKVLGCARPYR